MKRTILVVALLCFASLSFGQKRLVKDAKSAMKSHVAEARELIQQALENEETKNDPETWKVAGDIEYSLFDKEREKEQLERFTTKSGNEVLMYEGLYNMYAPYIKADELAELPDEKGRVRNKIRKDITKNLIDSHPFLINGGVYFNEKGDFAKAADYFERYWELPSHTMFKDIPNPFPYMVDSTLQVIKYYAVISSIQSENYPRSIKLLEKINSEPYVENITYKESDTYELMANTYYQTGDTVSYVKSLERGAEKFPASQYFIPNLINVYIIDGEMNRAISSIDQAIASDPSNSCDLLSVKATIFAEKKEYDKSQSIYEQALAYDSNCARSLEGLGTLYILQAQDLKKKATDAASRKEQASLDKEAEVLYLKAVPFLEKLRENQEAKGMDAVSMRGTYTKLQNVYYNLNIDDKLAEMDKLLEIDIQ